MTRIIRFCAIVEAAALLLLLSAASLTAKTRPNILFIAVDDLNDWTNCLGGCPSPIRTPNLDRLAASGVLFTAAYCAAPACGPSRAAVMTGLRPSTTGVYFNKIHWRSSPRTRNAVTIPEYLRQYGYEVYGGGKIFHALSFGGPGTKSDGDNDPKCWDFYFPSMLRAMPDPAWPKGWPANQPELDRQRGYVGKRPIKFMEWIPLDEDDHVMADYKVVDWAISQLRRKHDKPFFQAVGIFRPHIPWFVPRKYYDMYPLDKIRLPEVKANDLDDARKHSKQWWHRWVVRNHQWKKAIQGYMASITFADVQIGRLIDALEKSRYANNTIVVLWSDHGFHLGEKENWEKFTLWEEATRVTLMVRAPGVTRPGGRCADPVSLVDIYPTLNELCGVPEKAGLDGVSLVPLLRDPEAPSERAVLTTYGKGNHAVRSRRWRYIRYEDGFEELYDHQNDPNEWTNLAGDPKYAEVIRDLARRLPKTEADYPGGKRIYGCTILSARPIDPETAAKVRKGLIELK